MVFEVSTAACPHPFDRHTHKPQKKSRVMMGKRASNGGRKRIVLWSVSLIEGVWRTHLNDLILAQATVGIHLKVGQDL